MAKAEDLRVQVMEEILAEEPRVSIRMCSAEGFGLHQAVGTSRRILIIRNVQVLGIKFQN